MTLLVINMNNYCRSTGIPKIFIIIALSFVTLLFLVKLMYISKKNPTRLSSDKFVKYANNYKVNDDPEIKLMHVRKNNPGLSRGKFVKHETNYSVADDPQIKLMHNSKHNPGFSSDQFLKYENNYSVNDDPEYLNFVRSHWIISPTKKKIQPDKNVAKADYSQANQSKFVDTLLSKRRNGFFVECGAIDGIYLSNSVFFEQKRNWSGLLLEPNFEFFQKLLQATRKKAYLANVCLNTEKSSGKHNFSAHGVFGGISDSKKFPVINKAAPIVVVQCFPLEVLLGALGINHVDYFSLDVEGAEVEILKTIPFDKIKIDVIGIEYRVISENGLRYEETLNKLETLRKFFSKIGNYKEVGILTDFKEVGSEKQEKEGKGLDVFFQRI